MDLFLSEMDARQQQQARLREVEAARLERQALAGRKNRSPVCASLASLGARLEAWGCRLQARFGQVKAGDPAGVAYQ
jgi:hypothetical protein